MEDKLPQIRGKEQTTDWLCNPKERFRGPGLTWELKERESRDCLRQGVSAMHYSLRTNGQVVIGVHLTFSAAVHALPWHLLNDCSFGGNFSLVFMLELGTVTEHPNWFSSLSVHLWHLNHFSNSCLSNNSTYIHRLCLSWTHPSCWSCILMVSEFFCRKLGIYFLFYSLWSQWTKKKVSEIPLKNKTVL